MRFVPEVQHEEVANVFIEEPIKGHVSLNPNISPSDHHKLGRSFTMNPLNSALHYESSHEEGNTNFLVLNHNLGSSRVTALEPDHSVRTPKLDQGPDMFEGSDMFDLDKTP
jgi:hypothetical protein